MTGRAMPTVPRFSDRPESLPPSRNWLTALRAYLLTVALSNLLWEAAHLPLYTIWRTGTLRENLFAVLHCTAGDVLIALTALILALVLAGDRDWPVRRFAIVTAITLVIGLGYAVFSEWLNVAIRKSWAYSDLMPVISMLGLNVGVSPLLQWIVVPVFAFSLSLRVGVRQMGRR
jgi:hypothetical protein